MGFIYSLYEYLFAFTLIAFAAIFLYYKWSFQYWKKYNIQYIEPTFPLGTPNFNGCAGMQCKFAYNALKAKGYKHIGVYLSANPIYFPVDIKIIQCIMQQDFQYFYERGFYYNERDDPLSANLFALGGEKWRFIRTKISPAFTAGKLKLMFESLTACAYQMEKFVNDLCKNKQPLEAKEAMACYTTDVIGACAFGLDCNSFTHPNAEFRRKGKEIFEFNSVERIVRTIFAFWFPNKARSLGVRLFDQTLTDFFMNVVQNSLKYRTDNKIVRKDILQLLMELEKDLNIDDEATLKELTAQAFIFFAAGFETSSTTLYFCLYELAENPHIQDKLGEEITEILAKHQGQITYDAIMDMKYLNQVVDETLRKYPPLGFLTRVCVKDYKIPDTDVVIEKGIQVVIPLMGIHYDPEYYPEPEKFDPERFSEENKKKRPPFAYIPFGEGPRICIGLRFGLMQVKVGLVALLKNYKFSLNKKTKVPLEFQTFNFTLAPKTGIYLDVKKRINDFK